MGLGRLPQRNRIKNETLRIRKVKGLSVVIVLQSKTQGEGECPRQAAHGTFRGG